MAAPAPDSFFWVATSSLQAACTTRAHVSFQALFYSFCSWRGTGSSKHGEQSLLPAFGVLGSSAALWLQGRGGMDEMGIGGPGGGDAAKASPQV